MKLGMDFRLCGPRQLWPEREFVAKLLDIASASNAKLRVCDGVGEALPGADFAYTDVWLSMGEAKEKWAGRIRLRQTANPHAKFMHCLPASHNVETKIGGEIAQAFGLDRIEVTEDVFEGLASIVFDKGENRMHTIKAVLVATLGG
jgi:ornithine carbamoyltransferase